MEVRQYDDLGYTLTTVKSTKLKTNLISVTFQSEISRETVTQRSLLPYVLRSGSAKYPSKKDLNTYLETLYGSSLSVTVEKKGQTHNVKFYLSVANDKFIQSESQLLVNGIELLKEVLLHPLTENGSFKTSIVDVEKRLLKEYIESLYDDKMSYSLQKLIELMCKDERFSTNTIGYIEDLDTMTAQDVYKEYESMLKNDQMMICVVGDIDHEAVHKEFKQHFTFEHPNKIVDVVDKEDKKITEVVVEKEIQAITQGKLNIGYRTNTRIGEADYIPLLVFNGVFGGYAHSKLFMNVREKASLCYYCGTRLDNYKGVMYIYSGIENKNYDKALEIIDQQLEDMRVGNFTDKEIDLAKKSLINSKLESMDSASGMMAHVSLNTVLGQDVTVEEWVNSVNAVSADDIKRVAAKIEKDTIFFLTGKEVTE
ncbi:MAG TPA: insulinase family protein [Firmicutes bacterium]|nr:insulinase family protein [Bacillota bacterium]